MLPTYQEPVSVTADSPSGAAEAVTIGGDR